MSSNFVQTFVINCDESSLRTIIEKTGEECPGINIKFSQLSDSESTFELSFCSSSETITNKAEAVFRFLLPTNALKPRLAPNSTQSINTLMKYSAENEFVRNSIELITKSLNDYKPEEICIAFNGGKDCTALLHMVYTVFITKYPNNKLNAYYIEIPETFASLDNFVRLSVARYDLNLITVCGADYKLALESLKQKTNIKAIFMGTRFSDMPSHVVLSPTQMTDPDWPQFLRISPMLNWSYGQVWSFIRDNDILYCSLYDRGYVPFDPIPLSNSYSDKLLFRYTSVGSTQNTTQNPLLKYVSRNGQTFYLPAYMLTDAEHERSGRSH